MKGFVEDVRNENETEDNADKEKILFIGPDSK